MRLLAGKISRRDGKGSNTGASTPRPAGELISFGSFFTFGARWGLGLGVLGSTIGASGPIVRNPPRRIAFTFVTSCFGLGFRRPTPSPSRDPAQREVEGTG
jgi:hypothetical protein